VTGGTVVNATLTVNTVAASTTTAANDAPLLGKRLGGIMLGCVLIFLAPKRRRWTALGLLLLTAGAMAVTACGGSGHSSTGTGGSPGTPAGSYTVTVTAVSGAINATTQVNVTVQ
jgi:peptidoglycan/LPS O-acetylase OafA/YrhL